MHQRNFVISPHTFTAAEHCPAARVYRGPKQPPSHGAWHGIAIHRFIEYAKKWDREYALDYIRKKFPRREAFCASLDVDSIPNGTLEAQFIIDTREQISILLDPGTVRGEASARDHIMVRGDLMVDSDIPWMIDFKTGDREYDMSTSAQALLEALSVWLMHRRPAMVRTSIYRVKKGEITPTHKDWTVPELEAAMVRARRVHLSVLETRAELHQEGVEPEFVPGDHCYRCDVRVTCPHSPGADQ